MASVPIKISKIGFCNFKFEDGQIPEGWEAPSDISNHYGIEFSFEYSWNGNNCYITNIQSEPIELDNTRHVNREGIELQSVEFKNDKCLTIDFNSAYLVNSESEFDTTIYGDEPKVYLGENENLEYEVTNSSYMLANFKYENMTQMGNEEDGFSTVTYYIDILNIKIPKPSKYENNVVFTEEGVKELVGEVESKLSKFGGIMTGNITWGENALGTTPVTSLLGIDNNGNTSTIEPSVLSAGVASKLGTTTIGSANQPIYLENGNPKKANQYAGGTLVTLNGTSKAGTTVSFYAPTTVATSNAILTTKNGGGGLAWKATAKGAAYATDSNEPLTFNTLPVAYGGTGVTNLANLTGLDKYVLKSGDTITGTLILSRNTDASGTADNKPALIVGGTSTNQHIEIDSNEILAKSNGTESTTLYLQDGGPVSIQGNLTISNSGKLILNDKIYGTDAPTAATGTTTGQIYFQLVN